MNLAPALFQISEPLSAADLATYRSALSNLQGNILKSHGRDYALHIFVTFKPRQQVKARHFLSEFASRVVSAAAQQAQADEFKNTGKSELFATVSLSANGYEYLGFSANDLKGFSQEFRRGMQKADLNDPAPNRWEPKFRKPIHAMVILAHDDANELNREMDLLRQQVRHFADISSELGKAIHCNELGKTIRNGTDDVIEHFGYRDGVSQPVFFQSDLPKKNKQWDPSAGPSLVLVSDPLVRSRDASGSYLVFRKLEQNVKKFRACEADLANSLKLPEENRALAGAMIIGRFQDGTPVALHKKPPRREEEEEEENDFVYERVDPAGNRCPFFAHIRKANPRTGDADRDRRIARRGITYGSPISPSDVPATLPATGVGLLFQCFQADLRKQFEFLQHSWADNKEFPGKGTGMDPVIGQSLDGFPALQFPNPWNTPGRTPFNVHSFVKMKGGEYFFAPSISFLKGLKAR